MNDSQTLVLGTDRWLSAPGTDQDVVFMTRVRVSRNFKGIRFPSNADPHERDEVTEMMRAVAIDDRFIDEVMPGGGVLIPIDLPLQERLFLEENFQISRDLALSPIEEQLFLTDSFGRGGVFVNGSNHLNILWIMPGWQPFRTVGEVMRLENEVAARSVRPFAFDERLGYLTAHISEVGTAMKLTSLLHLPGLSLFRRMKKMRRKAADAGLLLSEYRWPNAAMWVLRNQNTLGRTEEEIAMNMNTFMEELLDAERTCRNRAMNMHSTLLEDQTYRALALCSGCRLLESEEATNLLSAVRMSLVAGVVDGLQHSQLNNLIVQMQPGHISMMSGISMPPSPSLSQSGARQRSGADALRYARKNQQLDTWRATAMRRQRALWQVTPPEAD